ncbi:hypothetical protein GH714_028972 [Hevea brasiliensis]|uniref:RNase H type-1 domain-containing protein n=1 Tax=Hevea brasiliensis TaxID=3981 RepID=A0A6A6NJQ7_HEVBR|nr:hypothetical protein GH714_028972 [Hevea brasiliensis]
MILSKEAMVKVQMSSNEKEECVVCWKAPPGGWIKLNSNDVVKGDAVELMEEVCFVMIKELGLKMAWGKEYTNVIVESDSMDVIKILQGKVMLPASCKSLIELIQRLWRQNWVVKA